MEMFFTSPGSRTNLRCNMTLGDASSVLTHFGSAVSQKDNVMLKRFKVNHNAVVCQMVCLTTRVAN